MQKLNYYRFLQVFGDIKHYEAENAKGPPPHDPLPEMGEKFIAALQETVSGGEVRPVVISSEFMEKHNLTAKTFTDKFEYYLGLENIPFEIPMPFETIWLEAMHPNNGIGTILPAAFTQWGKEAPPQIVGYLIMRIEAEDPAYLISAFIICSSKEHGIKDVFTINEFIAKSDYEKMQAGGSGQITMHAMVWHHQIFEILNLMCKEKNVGIDKTKQHVRVGKGQARKMLKIKNIVYVTPSSDRATFNKKSGIEVDWTHRWEVRGHWRKVDRIGKDQSDNYCIAGYTWVRPSVKGPEKAPLIQKTRFALPGKQAEDEES